MLLVVGVDPENGLAMPIDPVVLCHSLFVHLLVTLAMQTLRKASSSNPFPVDESPTAQ